MTEPRHPKYAVSYLLSGVEEKIAHIPPAQQRPWQKKIRALQQQIAPLIEISAFSRSTPRLPAQMTSAECALCRAHWREQRALIQSLRKRSAPISAWIQAAPPSGIWGTLALGKLRRAITAQDKQRMAENQRLQQLERQSIQIWKAFSETEGTGTGSSSKMRHIFCALQEKKQRVACQQAELFLKKYENAPLSALYDETQHRLDLWEAEVAQPVERDRLEREIKRAQQDFSHWNASLELYRAQLPKPGGLSETQQALLHWIPLYIEKLEAGYALAQQTATLRMWIQLLRLRAATEAPTTKNGSTATRIKVCFDAWEQKAQRVEAARLQIVQAAHQQEQAHHRQEVIHANGEAITSLPFLLDEAGRKTLFLLLQARQLSLFSEATPLTATSVPLRIEKG